MYANIIPLVSLLFDADVEKILKLTDEVPKQYRFPVYKELKEKLSDRLK